MKKIKLIEVKTKNFKGLGDFKYSPKSEGVNIIYGDNGVGKSSLIKIFNFLTTVINNLRLRNLQGSGINIDPNFIAPGLMNPYGVFAQINHDRNISSPIEFEMTLQMNEDFYKYGFTLNSQNHLTKEYFIKLKRGDLSEKKILFEKKVYDSFEMDNEIFKDINVSKGELNENNLNSIVALVDFVINIENNSTEEIMLDDKFGQNPIVMLSKAITILNVANNDWINEETYSRTLISMPRIQIHPGDKETKQRFYDEAEDFEDFVMSIDRKIEGVESREQLSIDGRVLTLYIVFVMKVDGQRLEIPFELMSTGTQDYLKYFRMIYLLKKKINGTVSSSVILFDEFGIHLHPSLAINILNYIYKLSEENGSQIILTSHQAVLLNKKLTNLTNKNKNIMIRDGNGSTFIRSLVNTGNKENHLERYIRGFYGGNDLSMIREGDDE